MKKKLILQIILHLETQYDQDLQFYYFLFNMITDAHKVSGKVFTEVRAKQI